MRIIELADIIVRISVVRKQPLHSEQ